VTEETFDIFSGAPDENDGLWIEAVEGFSSAQQRMGQIAAEKPGSYFLFSSIDLSVLTRLDTRSRAAITRLGESHARSAFISHSTSQVLRRAQASVGTICRADD